MDDPKGEEAIICLVLIDFSSLKLGIYTYIYIIYLFCSSLSFLFHGVLFFLSVYRRGRKICRVVVVVVDV